MNRGISDLRNRMRMEESIEGLGMKVLNISADSHMLLHMGPAMGSRQGCARESQEIEDT